MDRLEDGIAGLDEGVTVGAGWFLSTASGYAIEVRGRVSGEVALADAGAIVEGLSARVGLRAWELGEGFVGVDALAERWSISARTLHRYRRHGLAGRYVREGRSRRLVFSPVIISAFKARRGSMLDRAGAFGRLTEAERSRALERLADLRASGLTATAAAHAVARELGRSHESIRRVAREGGGGSASWTDRQRALALRAHDRALEPADIAERLGRDVSGTRRMIDAQRLARLRSLALPAEAMDEPAAPKLPVGAPGPVLLADLVSEMREPRVPDRRMELALMAYSRYLVCRAGRAIAEVRAARLRSEPIDAAERDLLWAARLRVEALRPLLGVVLRSVEARLGGEIEALPARAAASRLELALHAAAEAANRFDPGRGGRLSGAVSLAVDHAFGEASTRGEREAAGDRSGSARRSFGRYRVGDWTLWVCPWQAYLDASPMVRAGLGALAPEGRALLEAWFGLGERPMTLVELSGRFGIHRPWVARRVREAIREARGAGRLALVTDRMDA